MLVEKKRQGNTHCDIEVKNPDDRGTPYTAG